MASYKDSSTQDSGKDLPSTSSSVATCVDSGETPAQGDNTPANSAFSADKEKSFLLPLTTIDSQMQSKRILKYFATEAVRVAELAKAELDYKLISSAHTLYVWQLNKLRQCMKVAETDDEKNLITKEAAKVIGIIDDLEHQHKISFLTHPMGQFIASVVNSADIEISESDRPTHVNGAKNGCSKSKADTDVDKFLPEMRRAVQNSEDLQGLDVVIGYESVKEELRDDYVLPRLPTEGRSNSVDKNTKTALCLFGPPGTGKTLFAECVAHEIGYKFMSIGQENFASSLVGESLHKIRAVFMVAVEVSPTVLFFDELESILPPRANVRSEHKQEEINHFILEMNALKKHNSRYPDRQVIVFGATNLPKKIDPACWRRMENFVHVPLPTKDEKKMMLEHHIGKPICDVLTELDWKTFDLYTTGFSCSDIELLCREIASIPGRIVRKATHFRKLQSLPIQRTSNDDESQRPTVHFTPCEANHPSAIPKTFREISQRDIVPPPITVGHIILAAKNRPPTLDINDPEGPVIMSIEFNKEWGQKMLALDKLDEDVPFDSESAYNDAKKSQDEKESQLNTNDLGSVDFKTIPWKALQMERNPAMRPLPPVPPPPPASGVLQQETAMLQSSVSFNKRKKTTFDKFLNFKEKVGFPF